MRLELLTRLGLERRGLNLSARWMESLVKPILALAAVSMTQRLRRRGEQSIGLEEYA